MNSINEDLDPTNKELEEQFYNLFTKQLGVKVVKRGNGVILPCDYVRTENDIEHMEIYEDDVWLVAHPRTGSTWTREMVWCIANDVDLEKAKRIQIFERFPTFDGLWASLPEEKLGEVENSMIQDWLNSQDACIGQPSPRFIYTHLQWCVTYANSHGENEAEVLFQPFWNHVLEFWNRHEDKNLLFLKYEDMNKDLSSVIKSVAEFLEKDLSEDQVAALTNHLSFKSMKSNPTVNHEELLEDIKRTRNVENSGHFIRSGQVGGWKCEMSKDLAERFDEWIKENLKNTGLSLEEC